MERWDCDNSACQREFSDKVTQNFYLVQKIKTSRADVMQELPVMSTTLYKSKLAQKSFASPVKTSSEYNTITENIYS